MIQLLPARQNLKFEKGGERALNRFFTAIVNGTSTNPKKPKGVRKNDENDQEFFQR
jgi:hypothetical protein